MRTTNPSADTADTFPSADTSRSAGMSFGMPSTLWTQRREASLNWLALGLLLAAWNAADDAGAPRRPAALRAHSQVTVRAISRSGAVQSPRTS